MEASSTHNHSGVVTSGINLIASSHFLYFSVKSSTDSISNIIDIVLGTDTYGKLYLLCNNVRFAWCCTDETCSNNRSVSFLTYSVRNLGNNLCRCVYRIHTHIHRCCSRMIGSSVNSHHITLDTNDTS